MNVEKTPLLPFIQVSYSALVFVSMYINILAYVVYRKDLTHYIKISFRFKATCFDWTVRCSKPELRLTPGQEGNKETGQVSHFSGFLTLEAEKLLNSPDLDENDHFPNKFRNTCVNTEPGYSVYFSVSMPVLSLLVQMFV